MGMIQHDMVICVTQLPEVKDELISWIYKLTCKERQLFKINEGWVNYIWTIVLCPDGSKEGWKESDNGANLRERFRNKLREVGAERWVDVSFGELGENIINGRSEKQAVPLSFPSNCIPKGK